MLSANYNDKYSAIDFRKPIIASNKMFYDDHNYKIYIMANHIHIMANHIHTIS